MTENEIPALAVYDSAERWRCPELGGEVTFGYCRKMASGLPCHHLYHCWEESLDIDAYVKHNFTPEQIAQAFETPPRGRVGTIYDVLRNLQQDKDRI